MVFLPVLVRFDPWRSRLCTCPPKLTFNPYTGCDHYCIYCYASSYIPNFFKCRPKAGLISKLKREVSRINGEVISISNSSDPYPTIEGHERLTRRCLDVLSRVNCRLQIITKSNLVTRDIDILKRVPSMVSLTITTDDDGLAQVLEPNAPPPSERLKAAERLIAAEVPVAVRIDPIIPYVNDDPATLIKKLASIGVRQITCSTYKVKMDNWQRFSLTLPEVAEKLKPLYFERGERISRYLYLPRELRLKILEKVAKQAKKHRIAFSVCREGFSHLNTAVCDGSWMLKACIN
ncbi:radical SAM protein [Candidatus Bathyarchaeota archaeon]|nr:radical SAM protein [Candidatus Bathyarchaeota archaeon]